jgi:hypothetical protein
LASAKIADGNEIIWDDDDDDDDSASRSGTTKMA